ncbi:uncharacterized protein LOC131144743 [Malania oleifera]|uniref:uncharacterized protein LOC131144743 n=1 Tax=Malania oleifera TaxID=397392 RepID=UPI0025AEC4B9|nr:uncharacterized protein LOC131144743 [Malania oleifera]XP_057949575.1 uncharacterized protein LOC131144743 [Malania oleifera]
MEAAQVNPSQTHSKRSEKWIPVHAWLESLDKKGVVRSREISNWLSQNPLVKEQLYSRYSHYHLMHYVQKCHSRILKRRDKGKFNASVPVMVKDNGVKMVRVLLSALIWFPSHYALVT